MPKIGRKLHIGRCRCGTRNQPTTFHSRMHKDKQGRYLRCPECGRRIRQW